MQKLAFEITFTMLRRFSRRTFFVFALLLGIVGAKAVEVGDSIMDENFVKASIVIADPGDVLYSTVGHVGIHMESPEHHLDFFSLMNPKMPAKRCFPSWPGI